MVDRTTSETKVLRPADVARTRRPLHVPAPPPGASVAWGGAVVLAFIGVLLIPGSFAIGPLRLTPYRLFLLGVAVPLGLRWIGGRSGRITAVDVLMLMNCLWIGLTLVLAHGASRIPFAGITVVELFGAYLVGRTLIRNREDYRQLFRWFFWILVALFPIALIEFVANKAILREIFGLFLQSGTPSDKVRLGFHRTAVGFDHPIHFGLFCSIGLANVFYVLDGSFLRRTAYAGFVTLMVFLSLSSGPLLSVGLQAMMIAWDRAMRFLRSRWVLAVSVGVLIYVVLFMIAENGVIDLLINFVIQNLTLNPITGEYRLYIWQYATEEIMRHPIFGIGLTDWERPYWMFGSVDAYWLVMAMRYGLPSVAFLLLALLLHGVVIATRQGLSELSARCRSGHLIALVGLCLVLTTVSIWGSVGVFVMFYIGAGSWLYAAEDTPDEAAGPEPEAAAAAARARRTALRRSDTGTGPAG